MRTALDDTVINAGVPRYRTLSSQHLAPVGTEEIGEDGMLLEVETTQSGVGIAIAARTLVTDQTSVPVFERCTEQSLGLIAQELTVALFELALRERPRDARIHVNLGSALLAQGRPGEALASFRDALRLDPGPDAARFGEARALRDLHRFAEAHAVLEHLLEPLA